MDSEPITSLLIRETTILARDFGRAARGFSEIARALRVHLQPDVKNATRAINTERSGAEAAEHQSEAPLLPFADPLWDTREE